MEEAAADAIALAGELGWDRFSVIGHSMGAKVAHQMLLQAPERVDKLVGLNPVPANTVPMDEQVWELFSGAASAGNRAAIIDFTTGSKLTATFINHVVRHSLENSHGGGVRRVPAGLGQVRLLGQGPGRHQHAGEADRRGERPGRVRRRDGADLDGRFPEAEMTILPEAGHYPMFEAPVSLATSIGGVPGGAEVMTAARPDTEGRLRPRHLYGRRAVRCAGPAAPRDPGGMGARDPGAGAGRRALASGWVLRHADVESVLRGRNCSPPRWARPRSGTRPARRRWATSAG